ncbi:DUF3099 domain-containing protein [Agromyces sp. Soil535]|uniref:DUF3099 domain-containing protein n=1 Tax=Agromyces sp. Soil535 TaxID=1736390 RepID=UPI0009E67CE0|nr:DUF3099 domain-containing protein [Agromyces sp. Soil535]
MKQQSITSLPPSPEAERRARMIKYTIAMSIRVACIFAMLFAQGWWLAVFAAGAIFLPYVAVVLANVSGPTRAPEVLRPGSIVPSTAAQPGAMPAEGAGEPPDAEAPDAPNAEPVPEAAPPPDDGHGVE